MTKVLNVRVISDRFINKIVVKIRAHVLLFSFFFFNLGNYPNTKRIFVPSNAEVKLRLVQNFRLFNIFLAACVLKQQK